jgi:hypothetical protein
VSDRDLRRLSPAAQEVVRLRVVAALESELVRTYGEAAEMFGVSQRSVGTWRRRYSAGGREALAAAVKSRIGRDELISAEDRVVLFAAMADYTPHGVADRRPLGTRLAGRQRPPHPTAPDARLQPRAQPDEILNADIKRHVHPAHAASRDDLARETRRFLHRRQRQPDIVRGYFHVPHVRYTTREDMT